MTITQPWLAFFHVAANFRSAETIASRIVVMVAMYASWSRMIRATFSRPSYWPS